MVHSVRERGNTAIEEQQANFASSSSTRRGTNRAVSKQWSIKKFCLADKNSTRAPCLPSRREVLIEAGIGTKTYHFGEEFRDIILSKFSELKDGRGFDLLHCIPKSKHLYDIVISPSVAQSAKLLKACCWKWKSLCEAHP